MSHITAPYAFVPLSEKIVFPEWLQPQDPQNPASLPPLHDVPFADGLCGTLKLVLEAETAIFTRGAGTDPSQPFQLPGKDGRYALPGTALRGALRNVIEIATFGRFERVNDHRYAVRDLQNRDLYGQHMAELLRNPRTGRNEPMPLIEAGWLQRTASATGEASYAIETCDFAKIEYRELIGLARERGVARFEPGRKQGAADKYRTWGAASLDVNVDVEPLRPRDRGRVPFESAFGRAKVAPNGSKGRLVFTGQPSVWRPDADRRPGAGSAKHHDFVFLAQPKPRQLQVPARVFTDFQFAHSDSGQQHSLQGAQTPNAEWGYWHDGLAAGERMPVFYLMENGKLRAFGLAMMFRLPYRRSVGEAIDNASRDHRRPDAGLDFADGLFGTVRAKPGQRDERGVLALKGRVGIGHAIATKAVTPERPVTVVLGSPKASYYPNYVRQVAHGRYVTWMDEGAQPRGWKRYRIMTKTWKPESQALGGEPADQSRVASTFRPLPAGTTFEAHVDVHNLRPEELGALLWALDFGGDEKARHGLGMARPLGYGRVRLTIAEADVRDMAGLSADLDSCRARFLAYMAARIPEWAGSDQLRELIAIARPIDPREAEYQRLDRKEFSEAKKFVLSLPAVSPEVESKRLAAPGSRQAQAQAAPQPVAPAAPARAPEPTYTGEVKALQVWLKESSEQKLSAKERMTAIDDAWLPRLSPLAEDERKAALQLIQRDITANPKTRDWLGMLPAKLGLASDA